MVNVSRIKSKSVSSFINSLRSQGTKDNYFSVLKSFFEFKEPGLKEMPDKIEDEDGKRIINPDKIHAIDEVSLEYVKDPEVKLMAGAIDYEEDLRRYRDEVLEGQAGSSKKFKFRVLFRYLKVNQIEFDDGFMKNMLGRGKPVTAIVERYPTLTQLDMILDKIDPAGRPAILLIAKAGMRPEEVLNGKLKDLDLDYVAEFIDSDTGDEMSVPIGKLNIPIAKDEQPRFTFLIKEVEDEMRRWLKRRPAYIKSLKSKPTYRDRDPDESQTFPYGEATLRSMWETALSKCDLAERETITLRKRLIYRLHNLRKFFRSYGSWEDPDVAGCLMGHQEGMSKIYARKDLAIELLVKGIKQAELKLTSRRLRVHDIDDVRADNERLRLQIGQLIEKIADLEVLDKRVEELELLLGQKTAEEREHEETKKKVPATDEEKELFSNP